MKRRKFFGGLVIILGGVAVGVKLSMPKPFFNESGIIGRGDQSLPNLEVMAFGNIGPSCPNPSARLTIQPSVNVGFGTCPSAVLHIEQTKLEI